MVLGHDIKMTHTGGSALAVAYICNHETAFGRWPRIERIQRVRVLGLRQRGSSRDLFLAASPNNKKLNGGENG